MLHALKLYSNKEILLKEINRDTKTCIFVNKKIFSSIFTDIKLLKESKKIQSKNTALFYLYLTRQKNS